MATFSRDRINRARWSRDQRLTASERFAASLPSVEQVRAAKLAGLRESAEMLREFPHMAATLAKVEAEIARLSA